LARGKNYVFVFPRINFADTNTIDKQMDHICTEVVEAMQEVGKCDNEALAIELLDVIHSTETALRILKERHWIDLNSVKEKVIIKNELRGYYPVDGKRTRTRK